MKIGVIGDFNPEYLSQQATSDALNHSIYTIGAQMEYDWIPTASIPEQLDSIKETYKGFWIAPGIPDSIDGVFQIIRYARENNVPLIGTCGGFQHMILEFAKNKLMLEDTGHEELNPDASNLVISKLACSLVGQQGEVFIKHPSLVSGLYQESTAVEQFRCSYGLNPNFEALIHEAGLKMVGTDAEGRPRIVELTGHPFFIGTLFVPQLSSAQENPHCLVNAFIEQVSNQK
ncbi:CTP synthase C-terminal region-related (seleno)protein [Paenibacillus radicis (ex Gao et al. 2016)]|uniref:CTP synthase (glutamine hydrolyzing) n=1 Tax=Paenibacillus radicis (ex Gao et al. 2016) TaxID=1737354 RepID=A0A917M1S9_9BACL|nr:hypothetical protein [Paenibacillus radicis (ex Gao et al. 2016)]GGG69471.1 hypothetical protein GCM10010918_25810 [Paenibacillus radicis (ex Gao et al. 2016)]